MRKTLSLALEQLADNGSLAKGIAANIAAGYSQSVFKDAERLRVRVHELLTTVDSYLDQKAIKVTDIPKAFKPALDRLVERVDKQQNIQDYERTEASLKAVWGMRDALIAELVTTGLSNVQSQLEGGLLAVKEAEEEATKSTLARRKAEGSSSVASEKAAGAQQNAELAVTARKLVEGELKQTQSLATLAKKASEAAEESRKQTASSRVNADKAAGLATSSARGAQQTQSELNQLHARELAAVVEQEKRRAEIEAKLAETEEKAHKVFFDSTTAALAVHWKSQRENAEKLMKLWGGWLAFFVVIAVIVSVFIAVPGALGSVSQDSSFTFEQRMLVKYAAASPLVFVIWFFASQYSHARSEKREYSKRETVGMTLAPYRTFLDDLAGDDKTKKNQVFQLFSSAVKDLYTEALDESKEERALSLKLFNKKDVSMDDILALAERIAKLPGKTIHPE